MPAFVRSDSLIIALYVFLLLSCLSFISSFECRVVLLVSAIICSAFKRCGVSISGIHDLFHWAQLFVVILVFNLIQSNKSQVFLLYFFIPSSNPMIYGGRIVLLFLSSSLLVCHRILFHPLYIVFWCVSTIICCLICAHYAFCCLLLFLWFRYDFFCAYHGASHSRGIWLNTTK